MDFLSQSDPSVAEDVGAKIFNDVVHGHVRFPGAVMKFVDTPQFQRLRDLKQLGVTSFVCVRASRVCLPACLRCAAHHSTHPPNGVRVLHHAIA
jgi:hypothetical protein